MTYTGGYVPPGNTPDAAQTALPDDLQQAAVEQVAYWFRNRDSTGLLRVWPYGGVYESFLQSDLLLEVKAVLKTYERWTIEHSALRTFRRVRAVLKGVWSPSPPRSVTRTGDWREVPGRVV